LHVLERERKIKRRTKGECVCERERKKSERITKSKRQTLR
jgi:hypothetical protein